MVTLPFADRVTAGRALVPRLQALALDAPVVLALPRGGVPVAREVAAGLGCPLDLLFVRKIGVPGSPELAIAAVVDGAAAELVVNPELERAAAGLADHIEAAKLVALREIARRRRRYLGDRPALPLAGRTVVVVDDGVATGTTMFAALRAVRQAGAARVVVAVPVAPKETIEALASEADTIVCLARPEPFFAVGQCYVDFHQIEDDEVVALLQWGSPTETARATPST